ncbi:hypothetical protein [Acidisphaera rubrifaciens]|uniref:Uncharacterized protein n=1 Tax=Acidisphaera rubrifaciens HS-AP3 TaxID=1231350 RepID=A0A0D6P9S4_9PROT|nr:hypothetical protein [Acidisphaera rubrifaciens]GAN78520.1 hypothetical protein Asru_1002_01 [Acidisphaera rubrifaciens HS-AP3]
MIRSRWIDRARRVACAAVLTLGFAGVAHADFFDDMRSTFTTGIPHFFQDDIPCAFGGKPTSGTRRSCHGGSGGTHAAPTTGGTGPKYYPP